MYVFLSLDQVVTTAGELSTQLQHWQPIAHRQCKPGTKRSESKHDYTSTPHYMLPIIPFPLFPIRIPTSTGFLLPPSPSKQTPKRLT
jgi:hypothetical protein